MRLQAVFFDMGGTLDLYWQTRDFRLNRVYLIRECLETGGISVKYSDSKLVDAIEQGLLQYTRWNAPTHLELPSAEIWARFILKDLNLTPEDLAPISEKLAFIYETQLYNREMRPEIPAVLDKLKKLGLKIGIISNTQSINQVSETLKSYGIYEYFTPIVLSVTYGRRKPDPAIFYYAARLAKVPTGACMFVGDMVNKDIFGAKRAGFMAAVQIIHSPTHSADEKIIEPDATIRHMDEVLPVIDRYLVDEPRGSSENDRRPIKAIFFDAGDVLYFRPEKDQHLRQFVTENKLVPCENFATEQELLKELAFTGKIHRQDYFTGVMRLYGVKQPDLTAEGVEAMRLDDDSVEIIDGVPETMLTLKRMGFILGIITDTAIAYSYKLRWFERHGFGHIWDCVISSKEMGFRKPEAKIYESALKQAGVPAEEAVFVGHKASELSGAQNVGMHTVAFNYEPDARADDYIEHFCELVNIPILQLKREQLRTDL